MQKLRVPISKMKSHTYVKKFYSFQLFVNFSTDSDSPAVNYLKLVLNMQIYLYKILKFSFHVKKKIRSKFQILFRSILNLNWIKTSICKNPSKWVIYTTKMIQKQGPFAFPCFSVKVLKKRIIVHCSTRALYFSWLVIIPINHVFLVAMADNLIIGLCTRELSGFEFPVVHSN